MSNEQLRELDSLQRSGPALASKAWAVYDQIAGEGTVPTRSGGAHRIYPTGLSAGGVEALREIVGECSPSKVVETGFAYGLSSLAIMASALEAGGDPRAVEHVAIDPYAVSSWGGAGEMVIDRAGLSPMFRLIEEDSALALPALLGEGHRFDLAFVDGGHRFEEVFVDLLYAFRLVTRSAPVVIDDLWMPAVRCALDYFAKNWGVDVRIRRKGQEKQSFAIARLNTDPQRRDWDDFAAFSSPLEFTVPGDPPA